MEKEIITRMGAAIVAAPFIETSKNGKYLNIGVYGTFQEKHYLYSCKGKRFARYVSAFLESTKGLTFDEAQYRLNLFLDKAL